MEIARRLRAFREYLKISRTKFALEIGIGSERLASYESGRVPLRYEVFSAITKRFFLHPYWLATGKTSPRANEPFDDSKWTINPKDRFIAVFDSVLELPLTDESYNAEVEVLGSVRRLELWLEFARTKKDISLFKRLIPVVQKFLADVDDSLGVSEGVDKLVSKYHRADDEAEALSKKTLTDTSEKRNIGGVKSPMKDLLHRVALVTRERGKKLVLAKFLKVNQSRVSEWLRGKNEPGGDVALRLAEWVAAEEAKQENAPGSATNTAKGKTRSTQSDHEQGKRIRRGK